MSLVAQAFLDNLIGELSVFVKEEMCMLLGVKDEVKNLQRRLERFRGFLQYAEQKILTDSGVATLVTELKDVMYDADDIIDTCTTGGGKLLGVEPLTVAVRPPFKINKIFLSCFRCLRYRHAIGRDIVELNHRIDEMIRDNQIIATLASARTGDQSMRSGINQHQVVTARRQTSPIEDVTSIVGSQIEEAAQKLITSIVKYDDEAKSCRFFAITGMGGIGKTTLARRIFNDENITNAFSICDHENNSSNCDSKLRMWLHVSKDYSETDLLKEMVRNLGGEDKGEKTIAELEIKLVSLLPQSLFLVLDDVWREDVWHKLLRRPMNHKKTMKCRVLVTTRYENIAKSLRASCIHNVSRMDNETCWELLCKEVFEDEEEDAIHSLSEVGHEIANKCDGLPLAVKAVAGVLRSKDKSTAEWDKVLKNEMWSMAKINDEVPGGLYLSYKDLQPNLKQCFLYSSLISRIRPHMYMNDLVRYWIDEGLIVTKEKNSMEDVAEDCYSELIERNLLQKCDHGYFDGQFCTMHDLFQSLCRFLMSEEAICIRGDQTVATNSSLKLRRLFISSTREMLKVPDGVTGPRHLRTLHIEDCSRTKSLEKDLFRNLCNLRILMLSDSKIEELPNSIGELFHLRHLDVDRTNIKEIPNSIGDLSNLQTFRAGGCEFLRHLPGTVTRLHKLRLLHLDRTPLSHVPKGIGGLKNLNTLQGLIIGQDGGDVEEQEKGGGCDLSEIQHLSNLRDLRLRKLHRSSGRETAASVLADKPFLRMLVLSEEPSLSLPEEVIRRTQNIYNDLIPPSGLQRLMINNFPGLELPRWMASPSSGVDSFPNLIALSLSGATSCGELPPCLSQLPSLRYLHIRRADAITTIGPQFFRAARRPGLTTVAAFPSLQEMEFAEMPNWEDWWSSSSAKDDAVDLVGSAGVAAAKLLPNLRELSLDHCPKLQTLPACLSLATSLKKLSVETSGLTKIDGLPSLEVVKVKRCGELKQLSNLPSLRRLIIVWCPTLESVHGLDALQQLANDISSQQLPDWLSRLLRQPAFRRLQMHCNLGLLEDCLRDGPNWDVIRRIPHVRIITYDHSAHMSHAINPPVYETNVQS